MPSARVLLVDDSVHDVVAATRHLERCPTHRFVVESATTMRAGLQAVADFVPDCIVLDLDLGDADSLEFLTELHARADAPPVIALTGNVSEPLAIQFMRLGARDFLDRNAMTAGGLCDAVIRIVETRDLRFAIERSRAREHDATRRLEEALHRASFIATVGKRFAASLDDEETLALIPELALPFLGDACLVDLYDTELLNRHSTTAEPRAYPVPPAFEMVAPELDAPEGAPRVIRTVRPAFYRDAAVAAVAADDRDVAALAAGGVRALASVPLVCGGRVIGAMTVASRDAGFFTDELVATLEECAQRAASTIENARVLESARSAREQAEAAKRRLMFQSRVSTLFTRSLDSNATLERLVKTFTTSTLCDTALVYFLDPGATRLRHVASAAGDPRIAEIISTLARVWHPALADEVGPGAAARTDRSTIVDIDDTAISPLLGAGRHVELLAAWGPRAVLLAPFSVGGRVAGVFLLGRERVNAPFTLDDLAIVEDVARRTTAYLQNARLFEREHSIASALQNSLLPKALPELEPLRIASRYVAGADGMNVGGDWYDVIEVSERSIVITIGDVVGRGVFAAATMGQMRTLLRAFAFEGLAPGETLARLNRLLDRIGGDNFTTIAILDFDPIDETLRYARAGHPPPIVVAADGTSLVLDAAHGLPTGAWPDAAYAEAVVAFPPGSTLLLYTDGLVETRTRSASEGIELLVQALERASTDPEELVDDVLAEIAPDRSDDTAVLAIRHLIAPEHLRRTWTLDRIDERGAHGLRHQIGAFIRRFAALDEELFVSELVVGELVGNVVRHAPGPISVRLDWRFPELRVEVADRGPGYVASDAADPAELATSGRGLGIVEHIARDVRLAARPGGGTIVSASIAVRRDDARVYSIA